MDDITCQHWSIPPRRDREGRETPLEHTQVTEYMDRLNCSDPVTIVPYKLYNYSSENHGNECLILSCCGGVLVLFVHQVNLQCCVLHVLTTYTIIITNRQSVIYASLTESVNHSTGLSLN